MVIRKKKKSRKLRGSRTHGWGAGKKHRGAGHRGGRGKAGSGKRGQQKLTKHLAKGIKPTGKRGMYDYRRYKKLTSFGLHHVEDNLENWLARGLIKKEKDVYIIDTKSLGIDKILGTGEVKHKLKIIAPFFSKSAKEKIEKAGGEIIETK